MDSLVDQNREYSRIVERRARFKSRDFALRSQKLRRQAILERQRQARRDLANAFRALQGSKEEEEEEEEYITRIQRKRRKGFKPWREAPLAMPEWMMSVPERLAEEWFVVPRVDGKRCIVVAHNGGTTIRSKHGAYLRRGGPFASFLPGGNHGVSSSTKGGMTVLDCIYPRQDDFMRERLYVLDVMMWNGKHMYDCSAEFRFFWLRNSLNDCTELFSSEVSDGLFPVDFEPLPYFEADSTGIETACDKLLHGLTTDLDGLLFYIREGNYMIGVTPLVLIWKDAATSKHFIETFPEPRPEDIPNKHLPLIITLRARDSESNTCELITGDNPPITVAEFNRVEEAEGHERLLRFRVLDTAAVLEQHKVELQYMGLAGKSRAQADSWSRIEFQCRARHRPLTMESILHAAQCNV